MIYLDHAATTLYKPQRVKDAVCKALDTLGNSGRGGHGPALEAARTLYEARCRASRYFGAWGPEQTAFTSNATEALNLALTGLLKPGDHVITTEAEHNSVLRPLYHLENLGTELTILKADSRGRISTKQLEQAYRKNTRAVVCTHASNVTGNLLPIPEISAFCRQHEIVFILDCAQTAGGVPIDMKKLGIHILCFTGHKGLLGPQGTGGICVAPEVSLEPLKRGGSGFRSFDKDQPKGMPEVLEAGTLNGPGIAGLSEAFAFLEETGTEKIQRWEEKLSQAFLEELRPFSGISLYGDFHNPRCGVISLNIRDHDSKIMENQLALEYNIAVRGGVQCAPLMHRALGTEKQGTIRFSFSWFNTLEEVQEAAWAVKRLAKV